MNRLQSYQVVVYFTTKDFPEGPIEQTFFIRDDESEVRASVDRYLNDLIDQHDRYDSFDFELFPISDDEFSTIPRFMIIKDSLNRKPLSGNNSVDDYDVLSILEEPSYEAALRKSSDDEIEDLQNDWYLLRDQISSIPAEIFSVESIEALDQIYNYLTLAKDSFEEYDFLQSRFYLDKAKELSSLFIEQEVDGVAEEKLSDLFKSKAQRMRDDHADDLIELTKKYLGSDHRVRQDDAPKKADNRYKIKVTEATACEDEEEPALDFPGQKYTSERTSINSSKLPAIFKLVNFLPDTTNLDYGGGKYDNATDFLENKNILNLIYDPYNRTKQHNDSVLEKIMDIGGADTATVSNVLNVIEEPNVRRSVLTNVKSLLKPGGIAYFTVYEGDASGVGTPTKAGFQLNRRTADYLDEISSVFGNAQKIGKLIIAKK